MALSANSVVEIQTGGDDANGGGFVTGAAGTDFSLVAGKRTAGDVTDISTTDAVGAGTTTLTSLTANFSTAIVGNIICLSGGTGSLTKTWRQVTARASTTSITVDAAVATGTGITMNIGGALATPGMAGGYGLVSGAIIYIKAGTYTIASATPNIATGCFSSSLATLVVEGYQTTRGDLGTPPLLQASGISSFTIVTTTGADAAVYNLSVDGAGLTTSRGYTLRGVGYLLNVLNCTNSGFTEDTSVILIRCTATGCSGNAGFSNITYNANGVAYNNTVTGFALNLGQIAIGCIADTNTGASSDGFTGTDPAVLIGCTAYKNGRDGIRVTDNALVQNCLSEDNGAFGINGQSGIALLLINNGVFGNDSGDTTGLTGKGVKNIGLVTGSGSFFVDAANQNFALNNTAGAGAAVRAAGYPGVLPLGGTGYTDIGALQHQDVGGSGGGIIARSLIAGDG